MRLLVTGATGFTGGHVARELARRGDQVRALVRAPERAADLTALGVDLVVGDLTDRATLATAVAGVEAVLNIAAIYREAGLPAQAFTAVNAEAVGTLVEAAAAAGVRRVVHCSTVGVHGHVKRPPANEDAPLAPGDVYQRSKLAGEQLARERAAATGVELTIVRPSGIYGPGDRRLLKLFRAIVRRRFVMIGSGRVFYHLTYIDDLVDGFRLCAEVPAAAGRTYIIAGAERPTLGEIVSLIAQAAEVPAPRWRVPAWPIWVAAAVTELAYAPFGASPPIYRRRVEFFTRSRAFDIARARAELGYEPKVRLLDGIRRTFEWYRAYRWL